MVEYRWMASVGGESDGEACFASLCKTVYHCVTDGPWADTELGFRFVVPPAPI
jgi:hypothetical protein